MSSHVSLHGYAEPRTANICRRTDPMPNNEPELYSEFSSDENTETQTGEAQTESEEAQIEGSDLVSTCSDTLGRRKRDASVGSLSRKRSTSRDSSSRKKSESQDTPPKKARVSAAAKKKPTARKAPASAKGKAKSAEGDDAIARKVLDYMRGANRPFVVGDILLSSKNEIGRTQMLRVLGRLVEEKSIYCKMYGKYAVYCVVQSQGNVDDDAISDMDKEIENAKVEVRRLRGEVENLASLLSAVNEYPSDDVLRDQIRDFKEEIVHCKERLGSVGEDAVDVEDMRKADADIRMLETEIKKRKSFLRAIVDSLCEGTGMRKKELLCEIGLE